MPDSVRRSAVAVALAAGFAFAASTARAELTPEEVVIVAAKWSADSKKVAEHYAEARGIPKDHILYLDVPAGTDLPREQWDKAKTAIREWLLAAGLTEKVRCLVTVYDIPLRVGGKTVTADEALRSGAMGKRIEQGVSDIVRLTAELKKLAGKPEAAAATKYPEAVKAFEAAFQEAGAAVNAIPAGPAQNLARQTLDRTFLQFGGIGEAAAFLNRKVAAGGASEAEQRMLAGLQGELRGLELGLRAVQSLPESDQRQAAVEQLVLRAVGLNGLLRQLQTQRDSLGTQESHAAFDSELALLFWDNYPLARWVINPLHHRLDDPQAAAGHGHQPGRGRVVMVSRLEAVSVDVTLRMIDDAIAIEKTGLAGKVYIDARGLAAQPYGSGGYGEYDESLRLLADFLKKKTSLEVILDNREPVFAAGTCPDAALYCGWYSHANFVDSCKWVRGAVGYHIASSEAVSLRDPNCKYWCKNMLDRGVTATLGPVAEPYLHAFPRPDEFFPLVLTGKWTMAECYWRTSLLASWMNILIGDPLYRPFKAKPALPLSDLPAKLAIPENWGK